MGTQATAVIYNESKTESFFKDEWEFVDYVDDIYGDEPDSFVKLGKEYPAVSLCLQILGLEVELSAEDHNMLQIQWSGVFSNKPVRHPETGKNLKYAGMPVMYADNEDLKRGKGLVESITIETLKEKVSPAYAEFGSLPPYIYNTKADVEGIFYRVLKFRELYLKACNEGKGLCCLVLE